MKKILVSTFLAVAVPSIWAQSTQASDLSNVTPLKPNVTVQKINGNASAGAGSNITATPVVVDSTGKVLGRLAEGAVFLTYQNNPLPLPLSLDYKVDAASGRNLHSGYFTFGNSPFFFTTTDCSGTPYQYSWNVYGTRYVALSTFDANGAWWAYVFDHAKSQVLTVHSLTAINSSTNKINCYAANDTESFMPAEQSFPLGTIGTPPFHVE